MKQIVKILIKDEDYFAYVCATFLGLSNKKKHSWCFQWSSIRKLIQNENFPFLMSETEKDAWYVFAKVTQNFPGNKRAYNYMQLVNDFLLSRFSLMHIHD